MLLSDFIAKWQSSALSERAGYQEHFRDLCDLFGQPYPSTADPSGTWFTFEKGVTTTDLAGRLNLVYRKTCGTEFVSRMA